MIRRCFNSWLAKRVSQVGLKLQQLEFMVRTCGDVQTWNTALATVSWGYSLVGTSMPAFKRALAGSDAGGQVIGYPLLRIWIVCNYFQVSVIYSCMYRRLHACMHACMHLFIYIYICIYTYIYIYIYIHRHMFEIRIRMYVIDVANVGDHFIVSQHLSHQTVFPSNLL